jgi:putative ABC transport system permease protein
MHAFQVGDRIRFNIQGVPLEAVVSSVRDRTRDSLKPFFYFVFQPEVLAAAPQTRFAALRVPAADIGRLQSRIVAAHPNVSVIDATAAARDLGRILRRLGTIVRFFAAFSVLAGLLIVVSSVMATRAARIREAVYFKILGARQAFVNRVFALENLLIGLISGILAAAAAQAGAGAICTRILDIGYRAYPAATLGLLAAAPILVMAVGMAASRGILRRKPEDFLRRQDA